MSNRDEQIYTRVPTNFTPESGGAALKNVPVIGVVKSTADSIRSGRIFVYIKDFGAADEDNSKNWTPVRFMSNFYGKTSTTSPDTGPGTFEGNSHSYGIWHSPPDIGTKVICIFINGDINYGYYIGSVYEPEALFMVPAIGATDAIVPNAGEEGYGGAPRLPVVNLNLNNKGEADSPLFLNTPKPIHSYQAYIYQQQGLLRDDIRGPVGSSAQRESPSRVGWGVSTPGRPIYDSGATDESAKEPSPDQQLKVIARRGGHTFVMDDGDAAGVDNFIRLRSSLGHQILMSDNGQTLFIVHANGQSYVELGKEGTVDIYSTNSFNVRTQGDVNLHADNNVNIHAKKVLNIRAESINVESEKDTSVRVGGKFQQHTISDYTSKVDGAYTTTSGGQTGINAGAPVYVKGGSNIYLNSGQASLQAKEVKPLKVNSWNDTLSDPNVGWATAPGVLPSITSRAPAHQPWSYGNMGVDVKVNNSASANLPIPPSPALSAANATVPPVPANPVTPSVASTVPSGVPSAGPLNAATTSAMTAAQSVQNAATVAGSAAATVAKAAGQAAAVATTATNVAGAVGLSPQQMQNAGIIKPGSAALVQNLVGQGKTLAQATQGLMTGAPGAATVAQLANNIPGQVAALNTNFQQAATGLKSAGVLSGKESPQMAAGAIFSAATQGISNTVGFINKAVGNSPGAALVGGAIGAIASKSPLGAVAGAVAGAMAAGNFAAGMAANVTGGSIASALSGAAGAVGNAIKGAAGALGGALGKIGSGLGGGLQGAIDAVKGVAGSAFSAITNSFGKLTPGVPQNLTSIALSKEAAAGIAGAVVGGIAGKSPLGAVAGGIVGSALAGGGAGGITGALSNSIKGAAGAIGGAVSGITGAVGGAISSIAGATGLGGVASAVGGAVSGAIGAVGNAIGAVGKSISGALTGLTGGGAGGIGGIPGGLGAVTNIVGGVTGAIGNAAKSVVGALSGGAAGAVAGLTGGLGGLAAAAGNLLKQGGNTLSGLVAGNLPPAIGNQINAAIGSITSGASSVLKIPTVAVNTTNTADVRAMGQQAFAGLKIPQPTFQVTSFTPLPDIKAEQLQGEVQSKAQKIYEEGRAAMLESIEKFKEALQKKKELFALRDEIEKVSDEEYQQRGLGPKFKELKIAALDLNIESAKLFQKRTQALDSLINLGAFDLSTELLKLRLPNNT